MSLVLEEHPEPNVVLLRLNRPEARNALSPELRVELRDKFLGMAENPDVRAIVITGDAKAFAAGAYIRSMVAIGPGEMMRRHDDSNWSAIRLESRPVPVINRPSVLWNTSGTSVQWAAPNRPP